MAMAGYIYAMNQRKARKYWVHPINSVRLEKGEFYNLYPDLRRYDDRFFEMYRMHVAQFDHLVGLLEDTLEKQTTSMREPIPPAERLVITLRYVAKITVFICNK